MEFAHLVYASDLDLRIPRIFNPFYRLPQPSCRNRVWWLENIPTILPS